MLTAAEAAVLRNLAEKRSGSLTAFVNIADAQRLTELGFAQRTRQGWDITPKGSAYLASLASEGEPSVAQFVAPDDALDDSPARNGEADD